MDTSTQDYAKKGRWIEAGVFVRGSLRRELVKAGIDFYEEKGLLESVFIIKESAEVFARIKRAIEESIA